MLLHSSIPFQKAWEVQINENISYTIQPSRHRNYPPHRLSWLRKSKGRTTVADFMKALHHSLLTNVRTKKRNFLLSQENIFFVKLAASLLYKNLETPFWYKKYDAIWYRKNCSLFLSRIIMHRYDGLHQRVVQVPSRLSKFIIALVRRWKHLLLESRKTIGNVSLCCSRHIFCAKVTNCLEHQ